MPSSGIWIRPFHCHVQQMQPIRAPYDTALSCIENGVSELIGISVGVTSATRCDRGRRVSPRRVRHEAVARAVRIRVLSYPFDLDMLEVTEHDVDLQPVQRDADLRKVSSSASGGE